MTIDDAATKFDEAFRGVPWYVCVGKGANSTIYVYTAGKLPKHAKIVFEDGWYGFPLIFRDGGRPKPAGGDK